LTEISYYKNTITLIIKLLKCNINIILKYSSINCQLQNDKNIHLNKIFLQKLMSKAKFNTEVFIQKDYESSYRYLHFIFVL